MSNDQIPDSRSKRDRSTNTEQLIRALLAGERWALARAITLIESRQVKHRAAATQLLAALMPHSGKALRVGITGVPGVGKSTFIDEFGSILTAGGRKLAVLAVDPSSNRTKGSILGDKTRMERLSIDAECFVRPSPTSGELGGVAAMTRETMILCEAAGFDTILIETVGVGQSENTVSDMVDFFVVLMLPGGGDDLQGIKKGIIELADLIVVNKADGDNLIKAEQAAQHYRKALQIIEPKNVDWKTETLLASALNGDGLLEIWQTLETRFNALLASGRLEQQRRMQDISWLEADYRRQLIRNIEENQAFRSMKERILRDVQAGKIAPTQGARDLAEAAEAIDWSRSSKNS